MANQYNRTRRSAEERLKLIREKKEKLENEEKVYEEVLSVLDKRYGRGRAQNGRRKRATRKTSKTQ